MRVSPAHREWREMLMTEPCVYCGRTPHELSAEVEAKLNGAGAPMTIDHIKPRDPVTRRRRHHWDNEAPACWNCNHKRGYTPFLVFMVQRLELERERHRMVRWHNLVRHLKRTGQWRQGLRPKHFGI